MLSGRDDNNANCLLTRDGFEVHELLWTPQKVAEIWGMVRHMRTLFSDVTRDDQDNFLSLALSPNTYWMEIRKSWTTIGVAYLTDINGATDASVHIVFLDRETKSKTELCRDLVRYVFDKFQFHRLTAVMPVLYFSTIALAKRIGFRKEGHKRESIYINGKWTDEIMLSLLRSEI